VKNERTGAISGYEDRAQRGRYSLTIAAERCDLAEVFEIVGDDVSESTPFQIREVVNGVAQTSCPGDAP
ncbi:MAG: hypothetical protein JRI23_35350, partial [Deltaproteobacteria bacterium]|jgi:hypothetical protein|nr:hypothetical protein [Deltaproteobacteria bacterium]MBW2537605.1 hypothetical protein [Deltaproteobacteria bacterium]